MGKDRLKSFLINKMSMSHIYQPVIIKELLLNNNKNPIKSLAKKLLEYDDTQIEYYEYIIKRYPKSTLKNHSIINSDRENFYLDEEFISLSEKDKQELIDICDETIQNFVLNREGSYGRRNTFKRNIKSSDYIEVLRRAKGKCQLCGISKEERSLEVDHVTPKSEGGSDDISNLGALCWLCNSKKSNKSDFDYREF